jgi:hypothetical protein
MGNKQMPLSLDAIDTDYCLALVHEFLRCEEAFQNFSRYANEMILKGKDRKTSFRAYNAYGRFILHLYEFLSGCQVRDSGKSKVAKDKSEEAKFVEEYITHHTQRILNNRREAILGNSAPSWENSIESYPAKAPIEFAEEFRRYRNKVMGHVSYKRSKLSLSDFYLKYHKYIYLLYQDSMHHWGKKDDQFPDLQEITDFSVLIQKRAHQ